MAPTNDGSTSGNGLIYLPLFGDGAVQAIDPATQQVVATIKQRYEAPLLELFP